MNETITLSGIIATLYGLAGWIAAIVVVGLGLASAILPIFFKRIEDGYQDETGYHKGVPPEPAIRKAA